MTTEKLEKLLDELDSPTEIKVAINEDGDIQISEENFIRLLKCAGNVCLATEKTSKEFIDGMSSLCAALLSLITTVKNTDGCKVIKVGGKEEDTKYYA